MNYKKAYAEYVARIKKAHPNGEVKPVPYRKWIYLYDAGLA